MERQRARRLDRITGKRRLARTDVQTVECFRSSALSIADKGADYALPAAMTLALPQRRILCLPKPGFGCVPEWTASVAAIDRQRCAIALHRRNHRTAFARA